MSSVDLTGRTLCGRYHVKAPIGKGGMGSVYRAADENGRAVAIKVIGDGHQAGVGEMLRARLRREGEAGARLDHPNVVRFYEAGTDVETGTDFLVMELLHGEDLRSRLARTGRLEGGEAVRVLHQAASGLGALHRLGMVHRDIKPANLFLERVEGSEEARARVLDLGAVYLSGDGSETVHQLTVFGRAPISAHYAAPEQLRHEVELSPACDVFALGITAYEALTGALPFSERERDRMRASEHLPPPSARARVPAISRALDRVITRALEPRAANRYPDGDAFADALLDAEHPDRDETSPETRGFAAAGRSRSRGAWPGAYDPAPRARSNTRRWTSAPTGTTRRGRTPRSSWRTC